MKVKISSVIGKNFHGVHSDILRKGHSEYWLKGGRGSLKSSFISIEIVYALLRDRECNVIVFRKVADTIRTSVFANILWAIDLLKLEDYFSYTVSPAEIVYKKTGQKIIFKGLDKATKIKSITLPKGKLKVSWFEELEEYHGMEEIRNVLQSVARGTDDHITFYSYNPPQDPSNWVNKESLREVPYRLVHHSTYLEAPPAWVGEIALKRAEDLRKYDEEKYRHEYLGEAVGRSDRIIFSGRWRAGEKDTKGLDGAYFGLDFGFGSDPNVVVCLWIDWKQMEIYVEYAEYGYKMETEQIPTLLRRIPYLNMGMMDDGRWLDCDHTIKCDNSRPESVSSIRKHGFSGAVGALKGAGSIKSGISWLLGFTMVVNPRCEEFMDECRYYSYRVDKAGAILNEPIDKWNHGIDALRYSVEHLIRDIDIYRDEVVIPGGSREVVFGSIGASGGIESRDSGGIYDNEFDYSNNSKSLIMEKGVVII